MAINKRLGKLAAVTLTVGAVTIGGFGFGGVASADNGGRMQGPPASATGSTAAGRMGLGAARTNLLSEAAKKLGISTDALSREIAQGKSVKQIAAQRGIAYSDLKTTLVNAEGAALQEATARGAVTQSEANLRVSNIPQQVESFLTHSTRGGNFAPGAQSLRPNGQQTNGANQGVPNHAGPGQDWAHGPLA